MLIATGLAADGSDPVPWVLPWVAWCSQTPPISPPTSPPQSQDWVTYLTLRAAPGRNVAERYA